MKSGRVVEANAFFDTPAFNGQEDTPHREQLLYLANSLGGVDKLAMLGEQVSLRLVDRAAMPIDFTL